MWGSSKLLTWLRLISSLGKLRQWSRFRIKAASLTSPSTLSSPHFSDFHLQCGPIVLSSSHDVGLWALLETCPRSSRKMPFTSFLSISDSSFRFGYCVSLVLYKLNFRNKTNLDFFSSVVAGNGDIFISKLSTNPPLNKSDSR